MDDRGKRGRRGEKAVERFLRQRRYRVVTPNYTCSLGEIDLIVLDGDVVVFVEVKTRRHWKHGHPEDAVGWTKQQRQYRAAQMFLKQTGSPDRAC